VWSTIHNTGCNLTADFRSWNKDERRISKSRSCEMLNGSHLPYFMYWLDNLWALVLYRVLRRTSERWLPLYHYINWQTTPAEWTQTVSCTRYARINYIITCVGPGTQQIQRSCVSCGHTHSGSRLSTYAVNGHLWPVWRQPPAIIHSTTHETCVPSEISPTQTTAILQFTLLLKFDSASLAERYKSSNALQYEQIRS